MMFVLLQAIPASAAWWDLVTHNAYPVDTVKNGGENSFDNPSIKVEYQSAIIGRHSTILHPGEMTSLPSKLVGYQYFATLCRDYPFNGCKNLCAYAKDPIYSLTCQKSFKDCIGKDGAKCDLPLTSLIHNFCSPSPPALPTCQNDDPNNTNPNYRIPKCTNGQVTCECATPSDPKCLSASPVCTDATTQLVCPNDAQPICAKPAIGICAYHSKRPGWVKWLSPFFFLIFNSIDHKDAQHARDNYSSAECGSADFGKYGFDLIDCFPVPPAPTPPPFGPGPFSPNEVYAYKVCTKDELANDIPQHNLSSYMDLSENECVAPPDNTDPSTFYKQRVLISPTMGTNSLNLDNSSGNAQIAIMNKKNIYYNADVYDDMPITIDTQHIRGTPPTEQPKILDLTFNPGTGKATPTYARLPDENNDPRLYKLAPKMDDGATQDILATQVCVQEYSDERKEWVNIKNGCVTRPDPPKPQVKFCDDVKGTVDNPNPSPCLIMTVNDGSNNYDYRFDSAQSNCNYPTPDDPKKTPTGAEILCQIPSNTPNPFNWSAILTDACYTNPASIFIYPTTSKSSPASPVTSPVCYDSVNYLTTPPTTPPSCTTKIPYPYQSPSCSPDNPDNHSYNYLTRLYFSKPTDASKPVKIGDSVSGATKFCLLGYAPNPSPLWINTSDANTVCASTLPHIKDDDDKNAAIPREDIASRNIPLPSLGSLPTTSGRCDSNQTAKPLPTQQTRVKNPVEADLCVDVYPIKFKLPPSSPSPDGSPVLDNTLLKNVLDFCYQPDKSTNNTYITFNACMYLFNYCVAHPLDVVNKIPLPPPPNGASYNPLVVDNDEILCAHINNLHTDPITTDCSKLLSNLQGTCTDFENFCNKHPENTHKCMLVWGACKQTKPHQDTFSIDGLIFNCNLFDQIWHVRQQH